ncbi:sugar transporter [Ilyonectria robusta]|uniref:sugar transporter n=1 Tax=Ilyonectria robusta TaxID=1079257 RepID=UPI001E8E5F93|nr:sugar transporter [Ilyonectria robusta]KAH8661793.1 sugar transporter [Ilyonectria robusta]
MTGPSNDEAARHTALLLSTTSPVPWYKQPHLLKLNFSVVSLVLLSSAIGYDSSMTNGLLALPTWNAFMEYPTGAWLGFINCIYIIGILVTLPVCPLVANRYGRKMGIWIGFGFLSLGVGLQAGAQNAPTFILGRFFLGVNTGWYATATPLLITEVAYPPHRGIASSLYNCGWYAGAVVAAWVTFGTRNDPTSWSWRIPSVLQTLLPIIALPGFILCPESPRWLVSVHRQSDARAVLASAHAGGDLSSPLVELEAIEIQTAIEEELAAHKSTSYLQLFRGKGNRHRLLISVTLGFFAQWTGGGVVSYYLAIVLQTVGITSVTHQTLISACLQIWNLIFASGAAFSVDKLGRRTLFLASGAIMLVAYVIVTALSGSFAQTGSSATGLAVIPFLFIYYAGYDIALTPLLYSYPCEIWPYAIRSRGLTSAVWFSMLSLTFNIFVNPIALEALGWKYYIVFVAILIAMNVVVYFFYPETKGYTLEQVALLFDGEQAQQAAAALDKAEKDLGLVGAEKEMVGSKAEHVG